MIKQSKPLQTGYDTTYIYDRYYIRTHVYVFLFSVKNACLNYREFDFKGDLVGVPHTWYLSVQSFIRLLKLVWREYDIVAMNEWKKNCVGFQRTWVSKRTVCIDVRLTPTYIDRSNCISLCHCKSFRELSPLSNVKCVTLACPMPNVQLSWYYSSSNDKNEPFS